MQRDVLYLDPKELMEFMGFTLISSCEEISAETGVSLDTLKRWADGALGGTVSDGAAIARYYKRKLTDSSQATETMERVCGWLLDHSASHLADFFDSLERAVSFCATGKSHSVHVNAIREGCKRQDVPYVMDALDKIYLTGFSSECRNALARAAISHFNWFETGSCSGKEFSLRALHRLLEKGNFSKQYSAVFPIEEGAGFKPSDLSSSKFIDSIFSERLRIEVKLSSEDIEDLYDGIARTETVAQCMEKLTDEEFLNGAMIASDALSRSLKCRKGELLATEMIVLSQSSYSSILLKKWREFRRRGEAYGMAEASSLLFLGVYALCGSGSSFAKQLNSIMTAITMWHPSCPRE